MSPFASPRLSGTSAKLFPGILVFLGLAFVTNSVASRAEGLVDSGARWNDEAGNAIDAHGGGILKVGQIYYWYGESKVGPTTLPQVNASWGGTRVPFNGVSCYSSMDLFRWKYEGVALAPNPAVEELSTDRVIERPKVIYNARTKRFVMWMHVDSMDYREARTGVAVSDEPTGPFRLIHALRPNAGVIPLDMPDAVRAEYELARRDNLVGAWSERHAAWKIWARDFADGQMARDAGLFVDHDGTAYQFYASEENAVLHVSRLTDDYEAHAGIYRRITFDLREAPTPFAWNGRYYLVTSGCTGWLPNASRIHSADTILGPWTDHGSFFDEDTGAAAVSYLSQPTFALVVAADRVLFMADRWNKHDLQHSRYVWLPVELSSEVPRVRWHQVWDLTTFSPPTRMEHPERAFTSSE